jgi:FkbM family methyltransferase
MNYKQEIPKKDMGQAIPFNKIKSCRHGIVCYNQNDIYIGKSFDLYGEFSEEEIDLFRLLVTDKDVVLDIGANIGAHTLFLAKAVGPNGQVHAFEPQRIVFQTLCANMALNHIANAFCYNIALGKSSGTVLVPQVRPWDRFNFGGLSLGSNQFGEVVEVKTIDGLNLSACSFIKIDTEGMELDVLMGAANTIRTLQPILYVENDRKDKSVALTKYIHSLGYDMYWHKPPLYNPQNFFNNPENVFGDIVSLNMICLPRSRGGVLQKYEKIVVPK